MPGPLTLVGQIFNVAHTPDPHDEDAALAEQEGPFIVADAREAGKWLGLGFGGRWKTWVLGDISGLPLQWPKFNRFHRQESEAEGARSALQRAVEVSMPGAPILPSPKTATYGKSPQSRYDLVFPNDPNRTPEESSPIGIIMKDLCNDYDYAVHVTRGLGKVNAGNLDGAEMVSYRPPPSGAYVAYNKGINDRIDHFAIVYAPGDQDQRQFIEAGLQSAAPDGNHNDISFTCSSGVLLAFWSRLDGRRLVASMGPDPAMQLATGPLAKSLATPLSSGLDEIDERLPGPPAWAFLVNPGKWTARYWYTDTADGAGLSCCVFSRDGSSSWHPQLPDGFPNPFAGGMPPDPMTATKNAFQARANEKAQEEMNDLYNNTVGYYMPSAILARAQTWVADQFWAVVSSCVFFLVAGLILACTFGFIVVAVAFKMIFG
jgi:hypothetical protein